MPQVETMSLDERLSIINKAFVLMKAGDEDRGVRLMKTTPLPPYLAKVVKDKLGLEFLLNTGWNMSDVEAEYGSEWLCQ